MKELFKEICTLTHCEYLYSDNINPAQMFDILSKIDDSADLSSFTDEEYQTVIDKINEFLSIYVNKDTLKEFFDKKDYYFFTNIINLNNIEINDDLIDSIGIINNEYLEYLLEDENDEFLNSVKKSFLENESIKKRIFYYQELDTKVAYMLYYNGVDFTDLIKKDFPGFINGLCKRSDSFINSYHFENDDINDLIPNIISLIKEDYNNLAYLLKNNYFKRSSKLLIELYNNNLIKQEEINLFLINKIDENDFINNIDLFLNNYNIIQSLTGKLNSNLTNFLISDIKYKEMLKFLMQSYNVELSTPTIVPDNSYIFDFIKENNINDESYKFLSKNEKIANFIIKENLYNYGFILDHDKIIESLPILLKDPSKKNFIFDIFRRNINLDLSNYDFGLENNNFYELLKENKILSFSSLKNNNKLLNYLINNKIYNCIDQFNSSLFNDDILKKLASDNQFNLAVVSSNKEILFKILELRGIEIPNSLKDCVNNQNFIDVVSNYNEISTNFNKLGIDMNLFIQYSVGYKFNLFDYIYKYFDEFDEFVQIYNKLKYIVGFSDNKLDNLNNFIKISISYFANKDLFKLIINNSVIDKETVVALKYLLQKNYYCARDNQNIWYCETIDELKSFETFSKDQCEKLINNPNTNSKDLVNMISVVLFGLNVDSVKYILNTYGKVEDLKKLIFDNKNNPNVINHINQLMPLISIMEKVIFLEDKNVILELAKNVYNNYDSVKKASLIFNDIETKLKELYEHEINANLTSFDRLESNNVKVLIDRDSTKKSGVLTMDYSKSQYILLAHVKSPKESVEDLCLGNSGAASNFICLSAISHRGQCYYGGYVSDIIFGYSKIPTNSFVLSSNVNVSSNSYISIGCSEVGDILHKEKGISDTSDFDYFNNEILCYREDIKPCCIILPNGREPREKEIEIAKKYGLHFVKTQEMYLGKGTRVSSRISNPTPIEMISDDGYKPYPKSGLDNVDSLLRIPKRPLRKIGIITDIHGLYEPALAAIEAMKRNGVDSIISLGDDIGTGPNPKEVLELLEENHVRRIKGNHEIYISEGLEPMLEHLSHFGQKGIDEALRNIEYTRSQLTEKDIDKLKTLPSQIDLDLNGLKVCLCHSIEDYNNGKRVIDTSKYDLVFQGHKHFENEVDNVHTLRGAGIGGNLEKPEAQYYCLEEQEDHSWKLRVYTVPFEYRSSINQIYTSSMSDVDKDKIESWVTEHRGGRHI